MKAYSIDLREKVLRAVDQGYPREEIIKLLGVSRATIKRYLKQRRDTGTIAPKAIPGRTPDAGMDGEPFVSQELGDACGGVFLSKGQLRMLMNLVGQLNELVTLRVDRVPSPILFSRNHLVLPLRVTGWLMSNDKMHFSLS